MHYYLIEQEVIECMKRIGTPTDDVDIVVGTGLHIWDVTIAVFSLLASGEVVEQGGRLYLSEAK